MITSNQLSTKYQCCWLQRSTANSNVFESKHSVKPFLVNLEVLGKAYDLETHSSDCDQKGSKSGLHPHRRGSPRGFIKVTTAHGPHRNQLDFFSLSHFSYPTCSTRNRITHLPECSAEALGYPVHKIGQYAWEEFPVAPPQSSFAPPLWTIIKRNNLPIMYLASILSQVQESGRTKEIQVLNINCSLLHSHNSHSHLFLSSPK